MQGRRLKTALLPAVADGLRDQGHVLYDLRLSRYLLYLKIHTFHVMGGCVVGKVLFSERAASCRKILDFAKVSSQSVDP